MTLRIKLKSINEKLNKHKRIKNPAHLPVRPSTHPDGRICLNISNEKYK